jgi:hypothetical protein
MIFKGTVPGTISIAALNALTVYNAGWTYRVTSAGTIRGQVAEIGDLVIATVDRASAGVDADWTIVQTNIDGSVVGPASSVDNHVALFSGTSGKSIKDSGLVLSGSNTGDQTLFEAVAPSTQAFGDTASQGVSEYASRRDHKHAMPAAPTLSSLGGVAKYATTIVGTGAATTFDITHNLNTEDVQIRVRISADGDSAGVYDFVEVDIQVRTVNMARITFAVAPTNAEYYRVIIIG